MEILFVRHAEPAWIKDGRGHRDPELTERGHRQAARMAGRLADVEMDALWVSPALRARQTVEPLESALGRRAEVKPWLQEAGLPAFDPDDPSEVQAMLSSARRRPVEAWWGGLPGAEDLLSFVTRIAAGFDEELAAHGAGWRRDEGPWIWHDVPQGQRVVIVSHAGTTAAAVSHLLGLPQVPWAWERFRLGHAALARVRTVAIADGVIFGMRAFNDAEHHPPDERTT